VPHRKEKLAKILIYALPHYSDIKLELKMHGAIDSTEQTLKGLMKSLSDLYLKKATRPTCNNQEFRKLGIPTS
jgi:hypothetical protein